MDSVIDNMCAGEPDSAPTRSHAVRTNPPLPIESLLAPVAAREHVLWCVCVWMGDGGRGNGAWGSDFEQVDILFIQVSDG
jgi:hypothetical protein